MNDSHMLDNVEAHVVEMTLSSVTDTSEESLSMDALKIQYNFGKKRSTSMPTTTLAELALELTMNEEDLLRLEAANSDDAPTNDDGFDDLNLIGIRQFDDESRCRSRVLSRTLSGVSLDAECGKMDPYARPATVSDACARGKYRGESGDMRVMVVQANLSRSSRLAKYLEEERMCKQRKWNASVSLIEEGSPTFESKKRSTLSRFLSSQPKKLSVLAQKSFKKGDL